METPTRKRSGFTLIELLVVIGIIAILVSILLPTIGKVRRNSLRVACAANLRDIGHQFQMYLNEHKGRIPRVNPDGSTYGTDREMVPGALPLAILLRPYNGGAYKVFKCPADFAINERLEAEHSELDPDGDGVPGKGLPMLRFNAESWYEAIGSSYEYRTAFNTWGQVDRTDEDRRLMKTWGQRLDDLSRNGRRTPSQIWIFRDCDPFHGKVVRTGADGGKQFSSDSRNFLYADFHVGSTPYDF